MSIVRSPWLVAFPLAACGTLQVADDAPSSPDAAASDAAPAGDDAGVDDPPIELEAGADVTVTVSHRYAFVSSKSADGEQRITTFDALCKQDANAVPALKGRTFVAFVNGTTLHAGNDWYLPGDTQMVFSGAAPPSPTDLTRVPAAKINVDATGTKLPTSLVTPVLVWTGSKNANCGAWSSAGTAVKGDLGDPNQLAKWLYVSTDSFCGVLHHVYCFED